MKENAGDTNSGVTRIRLWGRTEKKRFSHDNLEATLDRLWKNYMKKILTGGGGAGVIVRCYVTGYDQAVGLAPEISDRVSRLGHGRVMHICMGVKSSTQLIFSQCKKIQYSALRQIRAHASAFLIY